MADRLIILDSGAIENLFTAGGEQAWSLLFKTGQRVVVPDYILTELGGIPPQLPDNSPNPNFGLRQRFEDWMSGRSSSEIVIVHYEPPPRPGDLGDNIIRDLMNGDTPQARAALADAGISSGSEFRLLSDDSKFVFDIKAETDDFGKAGLGSVGQYAPPYYGTFEFLNERRVNGDLTEAAYDVLRSNFEGSHRVTSLSGGGSPGTLDFKGQIIPHGGGGNYVYEQLVKVIGPFIDDEGGGVDAHIALKGGLVGGALALSAKFGLIGDVLSFSMTVTTAADLREEGRIAEANELWLRYIFETGGGTAGTVLGFIASGMALKGLGGPLVPVIGALLGGVAGSLAGAPVGSALYKAAPELFDPIFAKIYDVADAAAAVGNKSVFEAMYDAITDGFGFTLNPATGTANSDLMWAADYGERRGNDGDDVLIGWKPDYIFAGDKVDPDNPNSEVAQTDLRLTLDGGKGDDWLVVLGGTGAITVGGEGSDFIFNTSYKGQLYGDTIDGTGSSDPDVFWYWPDTFIMDADSNDLLQMFGFPLLGGSNSIAGIPAGDGSMAIDWLFWFVFYGVSTSGQLLIYNSLADLVDGDQGSGIMAVENYEFGGFRDETYGVPAAGDLGMTFRIYNPSAADALEISIFNAVWGSLFTYIDVLFNLAKALHWQPVDDPLVLDLDGDGIETTSESQSGVRFDLDGDFFAEKTGWLKSDDGFLVIDLNGNGRIDDISEMFGGPDQSGFADLASMDSNLDGVITIADAGFASLRVWRDLDQDGVTDQGELTTLAQQGIVSLGLSNTALDLETPQGNRLLAHGNYTRADGTTGKMFDLAFDTDPTDTVYRGERGIAAWLSAETLPNAKGFGSMTDLATAASNEFTLAETVMAAAASMTAPDLEDIRAKAAPIFGEWAQSLELTRELLSYNADALAANDNGSQLARAEAA